MMRLLTFIHLLSHPTTNIRYYIKPLDNHYLILFKVLIDNAEEAAGSLEEDWDFLPAKKIKDPEASKPSQDGELIITVEEIKKRIF